MCLYVVFALWVRFIKAPSYQQEYPGISTPLLGQQFVVNIINRLQQLPQWEDMAVIITYDDSDGWYDHVMPPIVNPSSDRKTDRLFGSGLCGETAPERNEISNSPSACGIERTCKDK
ncbi:MAG: alkaline phosphatase family protein [Nitrososphaerota archaeon]